MEFGVSPFQMHSNNGLLNLHTKRIHRVNNLRRNSQYLCWTAPSPLALALAFPVQHAHIVCRTYMYQSKSWLRVKKTTNQSSCTLWTTIKSWCFGTPSWVVFCILQSYSQKKKNLGTSTKRVLAPLSQAAFRRPRRKSWHDHHRHQPALLHLFLSGFRFRVLHETCGQIRGSNAFRPLTSFSPSF